jgi:hypothetical protein
MEIEMKIPPKLKNLFVEISPKFHGNSDENPDQVKKPIRGNIDKLLWQY